jgi:DNA-binding FadR family transcriptional regulator
MPTATRPDQVARLTSWALDGNQRILAAVEAHDPKVATLVFQRYMKAFRGFWEAAGLDYQSEFSSFIELD